MKKVFILLAVACAVLSMSGCGHYPQTAEEFRQLDMSWYKSSESYTVNRPYRSVARSLKRQSNKCLNVRTKNTTQWNSTGYGTRATSTEVYEYHPKVTASKQLTTLALQHELVGGNTTELGDPPPGGSYILVVDVAPASRKTTHVDLYWAKHGLRSEMLGAVKAWIKDGRKACAAL